MGYARTAGMSTAARRRRRRAALVLSALILLLLLVFGYAVAYFEGWLPAGDEEGADDAAVTTAPADPGLAPEDVTVNVVNNVGTAGLAGRTAEALQTYGYTVDAVRDDDRDVEVEGVDIRHGTAGEDAARQLQQDLFPDARLVPDDREDETVDLVLGEGFEELPAAEEADQGESR
ncbi:LytR C-terminal domain-containing protein [Ornithinicoccus halotolerans]|uniref:LytR C-terminal domain-containing protein n=1 Tax=Ornithinicoccus halotolerans TaxID=1748220 RepID=UPI0012981E76|nr:LytR C-terminal domain-containing protein [Ornithinicoccus halotolerans]